MQTMMQSEFCEKVSEKTGLTAGSVRTYLNALKFNPADRVADGKYNRPVYTAEQIESAVQLILSNTKKHKEKTNGKEKNG